MAQEIEIVFCNPKDTHREISLFYRLLRRSIARKYFKAVQECEKNRYDILDPDRFYNFPTCDRNEAWIVAEMNRRINIINGHKPRTIPYRAGMGMNQQAMNILHHYFEKLRGAVLKPGEFFNGAPYDVQRALEDYNLLIHRYEDYKRNGRPADWKGLRSAYAVLTFDPVHRLRYELADKDYRYFDMRMFFGSLFVSYCELGKPILDFLQDRDKVIGKDNIRPLQYYSGDTMLQFSRTTPWLTSLRSRRVFKKWWSANADKMSALGFKQGDPKNAIGHLRVAMLNRKKGAVAGLDDQQILALIGNHQWFKRVHCHEH